MIISPRTWIASHNKIDIDSTVFTIEGYSIFYISILQTISLTGLRKSCIAIIRDSKLGTLGWIFNAVFIGGGGVVVFNMVGTDDPLSPVSFLEISLAAGS